MRRGTIAIAFGCLIVISPRLVQAQVTPGFVNFTNAFSAAYGFNFPPSVAANAEAFALQPQLNNVAIQRQDALERQQGAVSEEDLRLPGLEELDPSRLGEGDLFGRRRPGIKRIPRRALLTANVRRGYPAEFYNRSTQVFYPEAAAGSHTNANHGGAVRRRSSGGGYGGFGGFGGIGVF